jgi:hypothetical protein
LAATGKSTVRFLEAHLGRFWKSFKKWFGGLLMSGINRCAERARNGELPVVCCEAALRENGRKCTVQEHYVDGVHLPGFLDRWDIGPYYQVRKFFTGKEERIKRTAYRFVNPRGEVKFGRISFVYQYSERLVAEIRATDAWRWAIYKFDAKMERFQRLHVQFGYGPDPLTPEEQAAATKRFEEKNAKRAENAWRLDAQRRHWMPEELTLAQRETNKRAFEKGKEERKEELTWEQETETLDQEIRPQEGFSNSLKFLLS